MQSLSDEEYFKYVEPLSQEGQKRVDALIEIADLVNEDFFILATGVMSDFQRAMLGEPVESDDYEDDIKQVVATLAKIYETF